LSYIATGKTLKIFWESDKKGCFGLGATYSVLKRTEGEFPDNQKGNGKRKRGPLARNLRYLEKKETKKLELARTVKFTEKLQNTATFHGEGGGAPNPAGGRNKGHG